MEHRRMERLPVGRSGLCRIGDDSSGEWLYCRLIDISMLGLGIYLQHPNPVGLVGRRATVQVPPFDDALNFRLEGEIRSATNGSSEGTVRVGIEFGGLSSPERYMVDVLTMTEAYAVNT